MSIRTARVVVTTPKGANHERVALYCPRGHEVVNTFATSRLAQRLAAGDYSGESCGDGSCGWTGDQS